MHHVVFSALCCLMVLLVADAFDSVAPSAGFSSSDPSNEA
jgi:hypothetical protein